MTTDATGETVKSPDELRTAMVDALSGPGALGGESLAPGVELALRSVQRHRFAPEASLEEAYDPFTAVVTKHDEHAEHAPFDAVIVTAGAWDIPRTWVEQLVEGGRLVVPLRMRNLTRSIGFVRAGDYLTSTSVLMCGFVPIQGEEEHRETLVLVNGTEEIALRFDDEVPADPHLLDNAVRTPRVELWTGATVALRELIGGLQLYLATTLPGFCTMALDPDLDTGLVAPDNHRFSMAAVDGGDFAYLVTRRTCDNASVEYGVHAFGPTAQALAEQAAARIREWAHGQRHGPGPRIDVYPASTPVGELPDELVVTKRHTRLTFSWPEPSNGASGQVPPPENEGE